MKKCFKIIFIVLILINVIALFQNVSLAKDAASWKTDMDKAVSGTGKWAGDGNVMNATANIVGSIIRIIQIVGTGISIIMITYVAIKYMSAAPAEKAEFKKSAMAFIVGAIVLFASTNILSIIAKFATTNI